MPCYSPLTGYSSRHPTEKGKFKIVFNRSAGYVDKPMSVPCGNCIGCRIDRSRMWALRCTHEARMHSTSCFVTLTYDDDHLPPAQTLVKKHLQDFFKRLRKKGYVFRYFAAGEYGDQTQRPHYHAILFGIDFSGDRKILRRNKQGHDLFTSETLSSTWGMGHCTIGNFSYTTAAYTARYVLKKVTGKNADDHYTRVLPYTGEIVDVQPEFALMSSKPGIGNSWYQKFKLDAFPSDFLVNEGKKHTVPRYYAELLRKEDMKSHSDIIIKRKIARKNDVENNTPDRLYVREQCKAARLSQLKRDL